jgi:hypothetical protein
MTDVTPTLREKTGLPADTWERAYADVLFSHIDRLNDVCEEDPLEGIVQSLRAAFDRVTLVDPVMNRNEVWRATHANEPWPSPGQAVWYEVQEHNRARKLQDAKVMMTFRGEDGRGWCLLQVGKDYVTKPILALRDKIEGPSYWELEMLKPEVARRFLQQAGILDASGELAPQFRNTSED